MYVINIHKETGETPGNREVLQQWNVYKTAIQEVIHEMPHETASDFLVWG